MGEPMSGQERTAAVNAFANRVADYVTTSTSYDEWSKRRIAVEAVTVAMEDAWHEVEAIAGIDAAEVDRLTAENERLRGIEAAVLRWGAARRELAAANTADHDLCRRPHGEVTDTEYKAMVTRIGLARDEQDDATGALIALADASPEENEHG